MYVCLAREQSIIHSRETINTGCRVALYLLSAMDGQTVGVSEPEVPEIKRPQNVWLLSGIFDPTHTLPVSHPHHSICLYK